MRIAYTTTYDPGDRRQWSGLAYSIMNALRQHETEVEAVGPLKTPLPYLGRYIASAYRRGLGLTYEYHREPLICKSFARQIQSFLPTGRFDAIFSPGAIPVSQLECDEPIIIYADATFRSYVDHYRLRTVFSNATLRAAEKTEEAAFDRARLIIFASHWAAESARRDYNVPDNKIRVIPFGANLDCPPDLSTVQEAIAARSTRICNLISIGVDWFRKGMPRAIALAEYLNHMGLETSLTIVGCQPPSGTVLPSFVHLAGVFDKSNANGEKRIVDLLLTSHFHVLFSYAEAFGVVFAEANACGVPNITSNVGGIPSAVLESAGGKLFEIDYNMKEIAQYVACAFDNSTYVKMAHRARNEYEQRLNWAVIGEELRQEIRQVVGTVGTP